MKKIEKSWRTLGARLVLYMVSDTSSFSCGGRRVSEGFPGLQPATRGNNARIKTFRTGTKVTHVPQPCLLLCFNFPNIPGNPCGQSAGRFALPRALAPLGTAGSARLAEHAPGAILTGLRLRNHTSNVRPCEFGANGPRDERRWASVGRVPGRCDDDGGA